jgi:peptidoglycan/LPS O-acetylase OafA/YrhL
MLEAWLLSLILPFHRRAHTQEVHSQRLFPLDGLRGVLAFSVFFTHAASYYFYEQTDVWKYPPSNFYSQAAIFPVSMFFFITAYLFWSKLARNPSQLKCKFLLGRVGRLAPAYITACCLLFLLAGYVGGFHRHVALSNLVVQVISWLFFWGGVNVNGVHDSSLWLGAAWTLRYEWLFYLSLPLLSWFARRKLNTLLLLSIAAATGPLVEKFGSASRLGAPLRFLATYAHFLAFTFSVGILVSLLPQKRLSVWARSLPATMASLIAVGAVLFLVPPQYGLLESACLAVPFACVCMGNSCFGILSSRPLLFLGRISYSFYLLHVLVLSSVLLILKKHDILNGIAPIRYWAIAAACGVVTIFVCAFSYQFLEAPFLHVGKFIRPHVDSQNEVSSV